MTEDQATKLIELLETFNKVDVTSGIASIILCVLLIAFCVFQLYRDSKIKQWRREYKATLTDEQLEAIKRINKIQ